MSTSFRTVQSAMLADWAPSIELAARNVARVVVAVYVAGLMTGHWLHRTNDRLARAYVALLGLTPTVAPVTAAAPVVAPVAPVVAPVAAAEPVNLASLTVVELRKMARAALGSSAKINGRRIAQAKKADLLEALN